MIWLSILVATFIAVLCSSIFFFQVSASRMKKRTAYWLTVSAMVISLLGMHFYGTPHYLAYVFENKIKSEDPIFVLLAQKDPVHFNEYLHKIRNSFLDNESDQVSYYTGKYIYNQLIKYSPHATNISFYYLAKATLALYNKIYAHNPGMVLTLEFNLQTEPRMDYATLNKVYNQDVDPIADAKKLIIESALINPQPVLSQSQKDRALAIIQNILLKLSTNYGNNVVSATFNNPTDPALNQKIAAEIIMKFYQMILDRGKDDGGLVVKYIYNNASL